MLLEILCLSVVLLLIALRLYRRPKNLPPGPPCLPIVGAIPFLDRRMQVTMTKWQKKYGNTFSFYFGGKLFVMINDANTIRKVMMDDNTTARDRNQLAFEMVKNKNNELHGLIMSEGPLWKTNRRFALTTLRNFGMGKTWLENSILEEVDEFCAQLRNQNMQPFNPKLLASHSVSNVICALAFGKRFAHTDEHFQMLLRLMNSYVAHFDRTAIIDIFPLLKHLPAIPRYSWRSLVAIYGEITTFMQTLIDDHEKSSNTEGHQDFIDAFMERSKSKKDGAQYCTDFQLIVSLFDLFAAGTETTATTILWVMIHLILNPEVLSKIRQEIADNIPENRTIRMSDRTSLPYTEATIMEVQRVSTLIQFGLPHQNFEAMKIDDFDIPARTTILTNISFAHQDPRFWSNPEKFDPTRFLDEEGKITRPDAFMPFAIGKRSCLGESLAKMELWLFISNMVHRFNLKEASGNPITSQPSASIFVQTPQPFQIIFESRW